MFRGGDLTIVLNGALSGGTGAFELVFPVESVAAVRKQLTDRGCHFTGEPREVAKGMWAATFTNPDGHGSRCSGLVRVQDQTIARMKSAFGWPWERTPSDVSSLVLRDALGMVCGGLIAGLCWCS